MTTQTVACVRLLTYIFSLGGTLRPWKQPMREKGERGKVRKKKRGGGGCESSVDPIFNQRVRAYMQIADKAE